MYWGSRKAGYLHSFEKQQCHIQVNFTNWRSCFLSIFSARSKLCCEGTLSLSAQRGSLMWSAVALHWSSSSSATACVRTTAVQCAPVTYSSKQLALLHTDVVFLLQKHPLGKDLWWQWVTFVILLLVNDNDTIYALQVVLIAFPD